MATCGFRTTARGIPFLAEVWAEKGEFRVQAAGWLGFWSWGLGFRVWDGMGG